MGTGRPVLAASLDEATNAALRAFVAREGITASGLVEALARAVLENPRWARRVLEAARQIDSERRDRRPEP